MNDLDTDRGGTGVVGSVRSEAPWAGSFDVLGDPRGRIVLKQLDGTTFELASTIVYTGERTGLEGKLDDVTIDALRWVSPERLPTTDLASVPPALRWFVGTYGIHTPAALIHDWMIEKGPPVVGGLTPQYADRYLRFMLRDLGVRWIRRWLMWTAVALRSRWETGTRRRVMVSAWIVAALVGVGAFVVGAIAGNLTMVVAAAAAPLVVSLLWGRQYPAGIWASGTALFILPPAVIGALAFGIYLALEWLVGAVSGGRSGTQPYGYRDF
jgi:hypothetical protein